MCGHDDLQRAVGGNVCRVTDVRAIPDMLRHFNLQQLGDVCIDQHMRRQRDMQVVRDLCALADLR